MADGEAKSPVIGKRYDFVLFFDVQDGNPNGDPDAGNLPRVDPETGQGLVTDVCLKRKVRNHVLMTRGAQPGHDIFIKEKAVLNQSIAGAYQSLGIALEEGDKKKGAAPRGKGKGKGEGNGEAASGGEAEGPTSKKTEGEGTKKGEARSAEVERVRQWMCERYFDVRTFGAVMSTGANAGQARGPVQLTFARSVEPIVTLEHSITRMAVATEEEAEKQSGDNRTMGRKATVPYGLYRAHGFVSPALASRENGAKGTGFSQADLTLLFDALEQMFETDRSAARGLMSTRALVIFEHESSLGTAPAHALFDKVKAERTGAPPAREFSAYRITVDGEPLRGVRNVFRVKGSKRVDGVPVPELERVVAG